MQFAWVFKKQYHYSTSKKVGFLGPPCTCDIGLPVVEHFSYNLPLLFKLYEFWSVDSLENH